MVEINATLLIKAYMCGVFPMAETKDSPEAFWVEPDKRGIIPLDKFHIPKSLIKTLKRHPYKVTTDKAFGNVIRACAKEGKGRNETWINSQIITLFEELHDMNLAHSIECWEKDELVGGLYGLALGGTFFGESMFHTKTNASKIALTYLVARLKKGGFKLLDTQFITDHLKQFGAIEITQAQYLKKLEKALTIEANYYSMEEDASPSSILQLVTQTS